MTGLLVSVRDADEARDAVEAGADLIDVKEPQAGSLGAASSETIREIVRIVAGRRRLSVALGELAEHIAKDRSIGVDAILRGVQFAKLGLAGCASIDWALGWRQAIERFPAGIASVAVVYADFAGAGAPPPEEIIRHGQRLGCRAMLIDTFDKRGPGLLGLWSIAEIRSRIAAARAAGMFVVLGGQVTVRHLPDLLPLDPDFIAVRGAVCHGNRASRLDPALVRDFKRSLAPPAPSFPLARPSSVH